jgi:hypothetical protein
VRDYFAACSLRFIGFQKPKPKRRKRISNKKEPKRDEFASDADFELAWQRWREIRNNNNESVCRINCPILLVDMSENQLLLKCQPLYRFRFVVLGSSRKASVL